MHHHVRLTILTLMLWVVIRVWYSMASFFVLPGWNTAPGSWNNDQFIDSSFWPTVSGANDIKEAIYGTDPSDSTEYTRYFTWTHTCNTGMVVDVIQSGFNTIPDTLSGNTIYVLDDGDYITNRVIDAPNDCTAIVWYGTVTVFWSWDILLWSTVWGPIFGYWGDHFVMDNLIIDAENSPGSASHVPYSDAISPTWAWDITNWTFHDVEVMYCDWGWDGGCFSLFWNNLYGQNLSAHDIDGIGLYVIATESVFDLIDIYNTTNVWVYFFRDELYIPYTGYATNLVVSNVTVADSLGGIWIEKYRDSSFTNIDVSNVSRGIVLISDDDLLSGANPAGFNLNFDNIDVFSWGIGMLVGSWSTWFNITNVTVDQTISWGILVENSSQMNFDNITLMNGSWDGLILSWWVHTSNFSGVNASNFDGRWVEITSWSWNYYENWEDMAS